MLNNKTSLFLVTIIYKNNTKCQKMQIFLNIKPVYGVPHAYHSDTND
jgi:hypothetical protein